MRSRFALAVAPALAPLLVVVACSSKASLVGEGGECRIATDCEDGLVCVPQKGGARVCSSDLSGVETPPEAPSGGADAGAPSGDAAPTDATRPRSDASDAATAHDVAEPKDTAPPPTVDTGAGGDANGGAADATGD